MLFKDLNLDPQLLKAVQSSGFTTPTEIQKQAIPIILTNRDLMASAQTGTGKTAAFVLPVLQHLLKPAERSGKGPRVLVLTPTRELAMQVNDHIRQFSRYTKFTTGTLVGGLPYPPQIRMLRKSLDLLVATPGRLIDLMDQQQVDLSRIEILVLDEADRMLDMGFVRAVKFIAAAVPQERQTLLFSATLEGAVLRIARQILKNPVQVALAANQQKHRAIRQHLHHADSVGHKHQLLNHLLGNSDLNQVLVFTATKRAAEKLAKKLKAQEHKSTALHGDMSQSKRKRTVEEMRVGKFQILVATDVAARGLDIKGISHVINFDLPMIAEDYIHRIGRTGRAGSQGVAISIVGPEDWEKLSKIEGLTGQNIRCEIVEGLEPTESHQARVVAARRSKKRVNTRSYGAVRRRSTSALKNARRRAA